MALTQPEYFLNGNSAAGKARLVLQPPPFYSESVLAFDASHGVSVLRADGRVADEENTLKWKAKRGAYELNTLTQATPPYYDPKETSWVHFYGQESKCWMYNTTPNIQLPQFSFFAVVDLGTFEPSANIFVDGGIAQIARLNSVNTLTLTHRFVGGLNITSNILAPNSGNWNGAKVVCLSTYDNTAIRMHVFATGINLSTSTPKTGAPLDITALCVGGLVRNVVSQGGGFAKGAVGEFGYFNRALNATQRLALLRFLRDKWAI